MDAAEDAQRENAQAAEDARRDKTQKEALDSNNKKFGNVAQIAAAGVGIATFLTQLFKASPADHRTIGEAAHLLDLAPTTLRKLIAAGVLPSPPRQQESDSLRTEWIFPDEYMIRALEGLKIYREGIKGTIRVASPASSPTPELILQTRVIGRVVVIHANGKVTLGENSSSLRQLVVVLLERGQRNILLNLANVYWVDSSGIGEMLSAFSRSSEAGGTFKLVHPTETIRDLLQITRLYTVFEIFDNEEHALASFSDKGESRPETAK